MKKITIPKLKKQAWTEFSKYIRLRDCLKTTGDKTRGKCFTCEEVFTFKQLQAGHFIDGRGGSVLFHEDLVHGQCSGCNVFKHGNKDAYTPKMIEIYGLERVEEFWRLKNKPHQWTREELIFIKDKYQKLNKVLDK